MFDISQLFIATAWAQAVPMPPGAESGSPSSTLMSFLPLILIALVFYVMLIRPQQKKMDDQQKMIKALSRGDRVVTNGGIHGKIIKVDNDDVFTLEIADGVNVKVSRSFVSALESKPTPVAASDGIDKKN